MTYYKTIIELDTMVENKVGEEVNSMKELAADVFHFITDSYVVEVTVKEDLYNGYEVLNVWVENKK